MATWPSGIDIGDARIEAGQPLTQDLMTDFRDRDDLLLGGLTLLDLGGEYYDNPTGLYKRPLKGSRNTNTTEIVVDQLRVYIPVGVTKLKVTVLAACTITDANHGFKVTVGSANVTFYNLPAYASIAWQTPVELTVNGDGWQNVKVETSVLDGVTKNHFCYGLVIKVSEA